MNRRTRKANLRKLQLPGASNEDLCKAASSKPGTSISTYFRTPNKRKTNDANELGWHGEKYPTDLNRATHSKENYETSSGDEGEAVQAHDSPASRRSKRTKLATFLGTTKSFPRGRDSDVFEKSAQMPKKAPRGKAAAARRVDRARSKRQPNIKSAFLRNEEMFSEITAQHCMADNFSPDDMQLALAISQSEAEKTGIQLTPANEIVDLVEDEDAAGCVRKKLQTYGFRLAPREDYNAIATTFLPGAQKGKRTKWANKFTALTLRNPEAQMKKLNAKIEAFLSGQFPRHHINGASNYAPPYSVTSTTLRKIHVLNDARIINHANLNLTTTKLEDFFVRDLFDVTRLEAGHLLKDWTAIQGRDISPRLRSKQMQHQKEKLNNAYRELEQYYEEINMFTDGISQSSKDNVEQEHGNRSGDIINQQTHLATADSATCASEEAFESQEADNVKHLSRSQESLPASPRRAPPDKKAKLSPSTEFQEGAKNQQNKLALNLLSLSQQLAETASQSADVRCTVSSTSTSTCSFTTQRAREPSPDIFADSDVDISIDNGNNPTEPPAEALHSITTYEIYTSDEVKTSCSANEMRRFSNSDDLNPDINKNPIVDLTQDNLSCDSPISTKINKDNDDLPYCETHRRSDLTEVATKSPPDNIIDNLLQKYLSAEEQESYQQLLSQLEQPCCSRRGHSKSLEFNSVARNGSSEDLTINLDSNKQMFLHRRYKSDNFSTRVSSTENVLDLTQSDPEDGQYECIILSDDEINYSIRKANNNNKLFDDAGDIRDLSLSSDSAEDMMERYQQSAALSQTNQSPCKQADFSLLELIDVNKSFNRTPTIKQREFKKTASTLSFDGEEDFEPISSQFLATPKKLEHCEPMANTPSAKVNLFNGHTEPDLLDGYAELRRSLLQERAEFGILDSYSEPFTQSPFKTPAKTANDSLHIECGEASFLESPTERPSFAKRHSSNRISKKFNSLLKSSEVLLNDVDDFDEFDKLVYGSPEPETRTKCNAPAGLSQLLTAEISFRDEFQVDNATTPALNVVWQEGENSHKTEVPVLNGSAPLSNKKKLASPSVENLSEVPQEMEVNGKVYTVRLDTRPKPDFTQQSEAELLKQLYNFGIKPLKRKQAIKMLEFIYNQTHPILLDADQEKTPKASQATAVSRSNEVAATSASQAGTQSDVVASKKMNLQEATGDVMLRFNDDLYPEFDDEFYIFQTNVSKKTLQPLLPLHVAWFNLICSNPVLHETVLMYEPIDLQEVYLFFNSLGYRYDPKEMKAFFDSRCIIFRYDLAPPDRKNENNRHGRKPKHKKTR